MRVMKLGVIMLAVFLVGGCAGVRERKEICTGLLQTGLHAESFQKVWGTPTRTRVISGDQIVSADWSSGGGGFYKGKAHFQVWDYESYGVELAFTTSRKATLAGWNTTKSSQELSAVAPDKCGE
jgi:hypothetical protein